MKAKNQSVKREYSAGGVVFKKEKNKVLWLLFQPKASQDEPWRKDRWQLPKGWIDEVEKSREAAIRETQEEGGVEVECHQKIDEIVIFFHNEEKEKVVKRIVFYLMEWQKDAKDGFGPETEAVVWLPFAKAKERLTFKSEKEILEKAQKALKAEENQPRLL